MTEVWIVVVMSGLGSVALKAAGPVLLGGRPLPARLGAVLRLAGPALLAALIATGAFTTGQDLVLDVRAVGLAAAAIAVWARAPALVVVVIAAVLTAAIRAIGG